MTTVRTAAEAHIPEEHGPYAPFIRSAVAVELWGDTGDQPVTMYVEMHSIGETLRPGIVLEHVPVSDRLDRLWLL